MITLTLILMPSWNPSFDDPFSMFDGVTLNNGISQRVAKFSLHTLLIGKLQLQSREGVSIRHELRPLDYSQGPKWDLMHPQFTDFSLDWGLQRTTGEPSSGMTST
jgi:hypothetical protein